MKFRSRPHKYGAKACYRDEIRFDSKVERECWDLLEMLRKAGQILFTLRQVRIDIGAGHKYVCDFLTFTKEECFFIEVKGKMLSEAKLKIDLAEESLGVTIHVVNKSEEIPAILFPVKGTK